MALRSESSLLNSIVAALTILWIRFLKFVTAPVAKDSRYQTLSSNKNIVPLEMSSVHFNLHRGLCKKLWLFFAYFQCRVRISSCIHRALFWFLRWPFTFIVDQNKPLSSEITNLVLVKSGTWSGETATTKNHSES